MLNWIRKKYENIDGFNLNVSWKKEGRKQNKNILNVISKSFRISLGLFVKKNNIIVIE